MNSALSLLDDTRDEGDKAESEVLKEAFSVGRLKLGDQKNESKLPIIDE